MFKAEANPRLTVLRMNKDFMDFMRFHYPDDAGQEFKMTVARAPPDPTTAAEPAFETPTRWDATEQRLEDEHGLGLSAPVAAVYCAPPLGHGELGSESRFTNRS